MKKSVKLLVYLMSIFVVLFLGYFILSGNYEFSGYGVVAALLFYILVWSDKYYDFPPISLWLFAIWIVLHMLGGGVYIGGTRLYDLLLLNLFNGGGEFVILKFDQFVHFYCYIAVSSVLYFILKKHFKKGETTAIVIFTILASIGVGGLNEIVEFAMVVFANAAEAVGGYYNTALDLVFNLLGAIVGAIVAQRWIDDKKD